MTSRYIVSALALAAALVTCVPASQAQLMGTAPYQPFSRSGGGGVGGVGMSLGYRQAILEAELRGQRSNPLIRDQSGFLLNIERRGSQAFVTAPDQPFLPGQRGGGFSVAVGGVGLGWSGGTSGGFSYYVAGPAEGGGFPAWIAMLDKPANELPWSGLTAAAIRPTPLNVWIGQLF